MRNNPRNGLIAQLSNPLKSAEDAIKEYEADEAAAKKTAPEPGWFLYGDEFAETL
ncbi:hypothetical protein G6M12_19470 [Agrobacterium tumefaciens]|nr:hypothetical protein [Agrobacterium tumefaciens]